MSDYTPTTEEVRAGYSTATYDDATAEIEFDRWLEEHDRQVARKTMLDWIELQVEIVHKLGNPEDYNEVMAWDSAVRYYVNLTFPLPDHEHTKRSSFGDAYCLTCGIDLEDTK